MSNVHFTGDTLTPQHLEKIRLVLSTYQDGTGQLARPNKRTLPGWRDFERAVALAFRGLAQESKAIYDVLVPTDTPDTYYGIACKMRGLLPQVGRTGRVTIEVSNSSGKFWDALHEAGIDEYEADPPQSGEIIIRLIESWHEEVDTEHEGNICTPKSFYLVLQWNSSKPAYQLYQYPIDLPDPTQLLWHAQGRRLIGEDEQGVLFEWYGHSGGQLKYYPCVERAVWLSKVFQLEPLPTSEEGYGLLRKVMDYYPKLWNAACNTD